MYTPKHFSNEDPALALEFMRKYNFAALVSWLDDQPFASHLPFLVEEGENGKLVLLAHMAKANPQWTTLEQQTSLVIFSEPHAYISPGLYEREQNVPTWNYIAIHAYGKARLIQDEAKAFEILEKQILSYESAYMDQWKGLSGEYKQAMVKGMIAFEMPVEKLESKWKLSQNKSAADRENVMNRLTHADDAMGNSLAAYMKRINS